MSPEAYNAEILKTLKSLVESTARIERQVAGLARTGGSTWQSAGQRAAGGGEVASDRDLDSERGNPTVRKDPKRWDGESYVGMPYSHCPPEYLDALAGFLDWQADMDDQKLGPNDENRKFIRWKRIDAARARGWAARIRLNGPPAPPQQGSESGGDAPGEFDDESVPF